MCVCVSLRKIDRKTENDRGKLSFVCVCVCVVYKRKTMKEKEIQVLKKERHCLGFPTSGPGLKVPQKTHPWPSELRTTTANRQELQSNKFTHSTVDRPANQQKLRIISLYLPGG